MTIKIQNSNKKDYVRLTSHDINFQRLYGPNAIVHKDLLYSALKGLSEWAKINFNDVVIFKVVWKLQNWCIPGLKAWYAAFSLFCGREDKPSHPPNR